MMTKTVHAYPLTDDLIGKIADSLEDRGRDLSRIAIVFPGERPRHFLNRELSSRMGTSFFSPHYFTIDTFIDHLLLKHVPFLKVSEMDVCYILYNLTKEIMPALLPDETFSTFLPWARELIHIIDQLDIDCVAYDELKSGGSDITLAYDIPDGISELLLHVYDLRVELHSVLKNKGLYTRGLRYWETLKALETITVAEFDEIYFCGFFFMHETEKRIVKELFDREKAALFFQGSQAEWPALQGVAEYLNISIEPETGESRMSFATTLHAGFDTHSQASIVHGLLKDVSRQEEKETVIVLPNPDTVIPLLSELSIENDDFNVSMGYPLVRSSFYSLCELIFVAQESRRAGRYYSRDYLNVLRHPIVKNLSVVGEATVTRVVIHKIEELLLGLQETEIGGSLFIDPSTIESLPALSEAVITTVDTAESQSLTEDDVQSIVKRIHELILCSWEAMSTLEQFAEVMERFVDALIDFNVFSKEYPLNINIVERVLGILDELRIAEYRKELFEQSEVFQLFLQRVEGEKIAFKGTPLNGLQILGRLETRSLSFKNVIFLDMNEGVMPQIARQSSLIPREVLIALGLTRLERVEEIERYHCMRLVRAAEKVSFVYDGRADKEKSRFIEELQWARQKVAGRLDSQPVARGSYGLSLGESLRSVAKPEYLRDYLLNDFVFSASSLNTYMECPLKFYYQYVLRLKEKDDFLEEPEGADVGTFIHELLETELAQFIGKSPLYDETFRKTFFQAFEKKFENEFVRQMKSDSFAVREVMVYRLKQFLEYDEARPVAEIIGLEKEYTGKLALGSFDINVVAKVDRIDKMVGGQIEVLDYKTGSKVQTPAKVDSLERCNVHDRKAIKKMVRSFQLPLYMHFVMQEFAGVECDAGLYQLRNLDITYFSKKVEKFPFDTSLSLCFAALSHVVQELFDLAVPFEADQSNSSVCSYCPFSATCL